MILIAYTSSLETLSLDSVVDRKISFLPQQYLIPRTLRWRDYPRWTGWTQSSHVHGLSVCAQSCLTLCDPMDWSPPGSFVHGILQARILEWGCLLQGIFPTQKLNPWLLHLLHCRQILYCWATREVLYHCKPRQQLLWNGWDCLYTFWYIRGKIHTSYTKEYKWLMATMGDRERREG